jgi:hypothetical protein
MSKWTRDDVIRNVGNDILTFTHYYHYFFEYELRTNGFVFLASVGGNPAMISKLFIKNRDTLTYNQQRHFHYSISSAITGENVFDEFSH